jgi:hypothetical protein
MHNQTKTILALLVLTVLATVAYAQIDSRGPGQMLYPALNVTIQINDARGAYGTGYDLCTPWPKGLANFPPYKFAAGKNFTLIIREIASPPKYPSVFQDFRVSAVANDTGFVTFSLPSGVDVTTKTKWYVAIVVEWPRPGTYFLIYEQVFENTALLEVVGNLSGRLELKGTKVYTGPWGVLTVTNGPGRFGNLSSSVIHTFYVGVNTLGKPFTLTFTRTVTIEGSTITLDDNIGPRSGPTDYVKQYDPMVTAVFGPFTYLATYVTSLGKAGTSPSDYRVSIDPSKVKYDHYVYITIEGSRGVVIKSRNDLFTARGGLRYVALTLNKTLIEAPMSCGLIIWNMTLYKVTINGLLDLKGNPIFNPEHFRYKIQMKVGDNWVTFDRAQATWKAGINRAIDVIAKLCGPLPSTITVNDVTTYIRNCVNSLRAQGKTFRDVVLGFYDPVTLISLGGQLSLINTKKDISLADLTTKLVVEYYYASQQDIVNAVVLEVALAELGNINNTDVNLGVLNVSVLPVQIRLWRWSNNSTSTV